MYHECPNCREGITYFRVFRTAAWRTFRCKACGSVLGISLPRRLIAIAIWLVVFLAVVEFGGLYTWGRLYTYSFMALSLIAAMYVGDRVVLVDRRAFTCRRCGYDLHGLPEPRCPECGTAFDPSESDRILARIHAPSPSPRYWWAAVLVVLVVLSASVGGLIAWRRTGSLPARAWIVPVVVMALAVAAMIGAIAFRRREARSKRRPVPNGQPAPQSGSSEEDQPAAPGQTKMSEVQSPPG